MRNRLLQEMEKATISTDEQEIKQRLTVVIAGGGPTGVELSGVFAEMRNGVLRKEYPELVGKGSEIYLVDGGDALLSPMSLESQQDTYKDLEKLGVKILLKNRVKDFVNDTVILNDGQTIPCKTLIWAAGVTAHKIDGLPDDCYGRANRLNVDEFNNLKGIDNIYAIGDTCLNITDEDYPFGHPQVAQVAIQQGENLAQNFKNLLSKKALEKFRYVDKGTMAIIGKMKAVVDLPKPKMHFNGLVAWLAWLFIHLMALITYRNRIRTLYNWMVAFITNDQSLRMIIKPQTTKNESEDQPNFS